MRKLSILTTVLLTLTLPTLTFAAGPLTPVNVGNWHGGSFTNDSTGRFSHCAVTASYNGGFLFTVSVSDDYSWRLGFMSPNWKLVVGQNIPVELTFDGRGPFRVFAHVLQPNVVFMEMPTSSEIIRHFRNATQMTAFANGQVFPFFLTDTSIMLPALVQCVRESTGSARPSPVASAPPVTPPAVTAPPTPSNVSSLNTANSDLHDEALELATNFILGARFQNPKVISKDETPVEYASFGANWRANDAFGSVRIITGQPDMKGIDVAAAVVGADAKECKGKFASARSSDMVDSEIVFRGFSSCEDSAGNRSVQYFIVHRKKGGFALFSVAGALSAGDTSPALTPERTNAFQKAALTAVK
jgi:hypothetical protein